ncbi:non-reducing end alpha-L-arabinofuranosidase family hydrolase [Streptomyces sp. B1I3]|uniref:non-reducing end alpha-L-arabinofuranosidase family hydrolase n=1 Tax=Streptomyces sp. B1I3 TaxID=3042264 RepID=UPI00359002C7
MGANGRSFRSWTSTRPTGTWTPSASTWSASFPGGSDVSFHGPAWTNGIGHGELLRSGNSVRSPSSRFTAVRRGHRDVSRTAAVGTLNSRTEACC